MSEPGTAVRPRVAVVGSVDQSRVFDPPLIDPPRARQACEELGRELAAGGWDLVVYSSKPAFVEADVVRGYVESGLAVPGSIHVHAPIGKAAFSEYLEQADLFDLRPDAGGDWEVAFHRSLFGCDGVLLIGGGRSTLVTGVIAMARRLPVLAVAAFGGNARKVWDRLSGDTGQSESDVSAMGRPWGEGAAQQLVQILDRQRQEHAEQAQQALRHERNEALRAHASLLVAALLLLAAVGGLVLSWGTRPGPTISITLLALVPAQAAAAGALIRTSLDEGQDWARAAVLGGAAGLVTGLLYVASQLLGAAEAFDAAPAEAVRRMLFFVLPIGFVTGLTFDAVYTRLRKADASQAATLGRM